MKDISITLVNESCFSFLKELESNSIDLPSKIEGLIYNTSISSEEIYDKLTLPQNIVSGEKIK